MLAATTSATTTAVRAPRSRASIFSSHPACVTLQFPLDHQSFRRQMHVEQRPAARANELGEQHRAPRALPHPQHLDFGTFLGVQALHGLEHREPRLWNLKLSKVMEDAGRLYRSLAARGKCFLHRQNSSTIVLIEPARRLKSVRLDIHLLLTTPEREKGMPRTFAPRAFLRHTANPMLARYFHERNLLADLDIENLGETAIDPIFDAYQALPDHERSQADSDFTQVDRMAHAQGEQTLLDEARFQGMDFTEDFATLSGFYDRAMLTFLDHLDVFNVASFFNDADLLPKRYWLRSRGVQHLPAADDDDACHRFANALGTYLRRAEGRGQPCTAEVYLRGKRHYFFAYPEDYGETHMEYVGEELQRRPLRSASTRPDLSYALLPSCPSPMPSDAGHLPAGA